MAIPDRPVTGAGVAEFTSCPAPVVVSDSRPVAYRLPSVRTENTWSSAGCGGGMAVTYAGWTKLASDPASTWKLAVAPAAADFSWHAANDTSRLPPVTQYAIPGL